MVTILTNAYDIYGQSVGPGRLQGDALDEADGEQHNITQAAPNELNLGEGG